MVPTEEELKSCSYCSEPSVVYMLWDGERIEFCKSHEQEYGVPEKSNDNYEVIRYGSISVTDNGRKVLEVLDTKWVKEFVERVMK